MSGLNHCPKCRSNFYAYEGPKSCFTCKVDLLPGEYQRPAAPVGFDYYEPKPVGISGYYNQRDHEAALESGK